MNLFLVPGDAIARAVAEHGLRLFARNVRDYLGENRVNEKIERRFASTPIDSGISTTASRWCVMTPRW